MNEQRVGEANIGKYRRYYRRFYFFKYNTKYRRKGMVSGWGLLSHFSLCGPTRQTKNPTDVRAQRRRPLDFSVRWVGSASFADVRHEVAQQDSETVDPRAQRAAPPSAPFARGPGSLV